MSETNFSSPYYTLHEASDLLKIPVEILIRQFEVGALKVRKRVTAVTLDKDNVEMTFEVGSGGWTSSPCEHQSGETFPAWKD